MTFSAIFFLLSLSKCWRLLECSLLDILELIECPARHRKGCILLEVGENISMSGYSTVVISIIIIIILLLLNLLLLMSLLFPESSGRLYEFCVFLLCYVIALGVMIGLV